jgi:hypothetical protein
MDCHCGCAKSVHQKSLREANSRGHEIANKFEKADNRSQHYKNRSHAMFGHLKGMGTPQLDLRTPQPNMMPSEVAKRNMNRTVDEFYNKKYKGGAQYDPSQQQMMCKDEKTGGLIQCVAKYQQMSPNWTVSFNE